MKNISGEYIIDSQALFLAFFFSILWQYWVVFSPSSNHLTLDLILAPLPSSSCIFSSFFLVLIISDGSDVCLSREFSCFSKFIFIVSLSCFSLWLHHIATSLICFLPHVPPNPQIVMFYLFTLPIFPKISEAIMKKFRLYHIGNNLPEALTTCCLWCSHRHFHQLMVWHCTLPVSNKLYLAV